MKGKDIALVAAAAVIAYLIYLYEKKKTAVSSQITAFKATSTPTGVPITDQLIAPSALPISDSVSSYRNLLPSAVPESIQPYVDTNSLAITELPISSLQSYGLAQ